MLFSLSLLAETNITIAIEQKDLPILETINNEKKHFTYQVLTPTQSLHALNTKKVDFAIILGNLAYDAHEGNHVFEKTPMPDLRAIVSFYPKMLTLVTKADSNITSIENIQEGGLRTTFNCEDTHATCKHLFKTFEIKSSIINTSFETASKALIKGDIDALFTLTAHPDPAYAQFYSENNLSIIPLFGKKFDQLHNTYPYFMKGGLPKDIYTGLEKDVKSIGIKMLLVTREDVNESLVEEITHTIMEETKTLKESHMRYRAISQKSLLEELSIPQHVGAIKAFNGL